MITLTRRQFFLLMSILFMILYYTFVNIALQKYTHYYASAIVKPIVLAVPIALNIYFAFYVLLLFLALEPRPIEDQEINRKAWALGRFLFLTIFFFAGHHVMARAAGDKIFWQLSLATLTVSFTTFSAWLCPHARGRIVVKVIGSSLYMAAITMLDPWELHVHAFIIFSIASGLCFLTYFFHPATAEEGHSLLTGVAEFVSAALGFDAVIGVEGVELVDEDHVA